ncbi:MAG: hypothetical protein ABIA12_00025 [Candidatus Aenigmatarchaeota archaeon]
MQIDAKYLKLGGLAALAVVALYFIGSYLTGGFAFLPSAEGKYNGLAKCLTEKGVVMYGLKTCPHCVEQKELFGESFKYVTYVECSDQQALCTEKGVQFVPAWDIGGKIDVGLRPLDELAAAAGCEI